MMRQINQFWSEQGKTIAAGAFATAVALAAVTVRYVTYFL